MGLAGVAVAAMMVVAAVITPRAEAQKRECALCQAEANAETYCAKPGGGDHNLTCLCNYPALTTFELCDNFCIEPDAYPERAAARACKNYTSKTSTELAKTATKLKMAEGVGFGAAPIDPATHTVDETAAELGSTNLGATATKTKTQQKDGPTIVVTLPKHGPTIVANLPKDGPTIVASLPKDVPTIVVTVPKDAVSMDKRQTMLSSDGGPLDFCGPAGSICMRPNPDAAPIPGALPEITPHAKVKDNLRKTTEYTTSIDGSGRRRSMSLKFSSEGGPMDFCGPNGAICMAHNFAPEVTPATKVNKRHNGTAISTITAIPALNITTPANETHPNPHFVDATSGAARDSNKEKGCLIAVLAAAIIALAQIKRGA